MLDEIEKEIAFSRATMGKLLKEIPIKYHAIVRRLMGISETIGTLEVNRILQELIDVRHHEVSGYGVHHGDELDGG